MSKKERYNLEFYTWVDSQSRERYFGCTRAEVNEYSYLQILGRLDIRNCDHLIDEIDKAEQGLPYDTQPTSDNYEDIELIFAFPNITIDDALTISMSDFKELLKEWRNFIQQKST